ncbi:TetR/AcrR family transcriptional regulator [Spirosoma utsteinense]|uniref:AcrR family transcriptional regulator n=1 Tax=Spirosoma utsteinense TaxID=2585773 RepID=A0ABR6VZC5_9BACT|nr:TetR/AcrR family transcriptional regulator [Spirosoma utsteinense]MBC3784609.1 AcrR family transcriptional regulator [Spirosoma utsteinense]MBC3789638.1 AcrR family transcriptional regulator [Spirosoma utsteinense]
MEYSVHVRMNERLFLRDPDGSDLGRRIIRQSILLFDEVGFEDATFRKLAERMGTKEASIYRYFENKHRLLVYLVAWYWQWIDFQLVFRTNNLTDPHEKLERLLNLLLLKDLDQSMTDDLDLKALHSIVIRESSKAYLTHHVTEDNRQHLFKPYKDLCARIAGIILELRPDYPYARSLASSLIETIHYQTFFMQNLPSLTDFGPIPAGQHTHPGKLIGFVRHLLYASLGAPIHNQD